MAYLWRRLGLEQRVAAVASILLVLSTFGPFSFVEAATILTGGGVLALVRARALGRRFHLPFGDGAVVVTAAGWSALLILVRAFDRPLGQTGLALVCAAILGAAGLRERAVRPRDDRAPAPRPATDHDTVVIEDETEVLHDRHREADEDRTVALPGARGPGRPPRPPGAPRPR